jgi:hypothetical protein
MDLSRLTLLGFGAFHSISFPRVTRWIEERFILHRLFLACLEVASASVPSRTW